MKRLNLIAGALVVLVAAMPAAFAAGGGSSSTKKAPEMVEAEKAIYSNNYEAAIPLLEKVVAKDAQNADALNYLGYSHRKLGDFETSKSYYDKALAADPKHRGAHEYIGELYLQLGDLPNAEKHLERLDDLCFFGCDEYDDLKKAIEKYKADNQG